MKDIPELGYTKGNVVICTKKINICKSSLTMEEIKKWMPPLYKKIIKADFLTKVNGEK